MNKIRRIGLKYCGGCKPEYDRVQAVAALKKRLGGKIELVSYEDPQTEGTLVVAGCPTACVDLKPFQGRPLWVVTSLQEVENFTKIFVGNDQPLL
ncbi:MAG: hypothetical protein JW943_10045 [Deltaproteobacteria bacterium]|nr:hypothetical protein [Deltaproteobacteria bacterium]